MNVEDFYFELPGAKEEDVQKNENPPVKEEEEGGSNPLIEEEDGEKNPPVDQDPPVEKGTEEDSDAEFERIQQLADLGLIEVGEDEEIEVGKEKEFIETKLKEKSRKDFLASFPEEDRELIAKALDEGVSVKELLAPPSDQLPDDFSFENVDETDAVNQEYLVEDLYKLQGFSDEQVAAKIARLKEKDLLADEAKDAKAFLIDYEAKQKQNAEALKQQQEEDERSKHEASVAKFRESLLGLDNLKGLPIPQDKRTAFADYMSKPVDKEGRTQFDIDYNPETELIAGYLQMTGMTFEDLKALGGSEESKRVRKIITRAVDSKTEVQNGFRRKETNEPKYVQELPDLGFLGL